MKIHMLFVLCFFVQYTVGQEIPMFVGTYTHAGSQGIYVYLFDQESGAATMYSSTVSEHPSFLARSENGDMLYAVNETGDSTSSLSAFAFDGDVLSFMDAIPTAGSSPCHVAVSKRYPLAVVSSYGGGALSVCRLSGGGALAEGMQLAQQAGNGPDADRQEASHVQSTFCSPDENHVYVQTLGTDRVTIYRIEKAHDSYHVVEEDRIATPPGGGPRHLV